MRDVVIIAMYLDQDWKEDIAISFSALRDVSDKELPAYLYTHDRRHIDVQTTPYRDMFSSAMLASFFLFVVLRKGIMPVPDS